MTISATRRRLSVLALLALAAATFAQPAAADTTPQTLPFTQAWTNTGLITVDNNWTGVPGIVGYRGDALTGSTGVDPQTVLADGSATPLNVIANQTNPNTLATGGVAEFHITDPVVALQGSGTARAPHLVFTLDTTGLATVTVAYSLRDVDGSLDNSVQPVALQYRVGTSGPLHERPRRLRRRRDDRAQPREPRHVHQRAAAQPRRPASPSSRCAPSRPTPPAPTSGSAWTTSRSPGPPPRPTRRRPSPRPFRPTARRGSRRTPTSRSSSASRCSSPTRGSRSPVPSSPSPRRGAAGRRPTRSTRPSTFPQTRRAP